MLYISFISPFLSKYFQFFTFSESSSFFEFITLSFSNSSIYFFFPFPNIFTFFTCFLYVFLVFYGFFFFFALIFSSESSISESCSDSSFSFSDLIFSDSSDFDYILFFEILVLFSFLSSNYVPYSSKLNY